MHGAGPAPRRQGRREEATMESEEGRAAQRLARVAGIFYLLVILVAMLGMLMLGRMIVQGDAATTAANLLAHQPIVRLAFASSLISNACYLVVTGIFFVLFRPVNGVVSLIAALFSIVGCAVGA